MKENPPVSVVVPVYNDPGGLRKLIPALEDQTIDEPYEVLLVDNNSSDETDDVLRELTASKETFRVLSYDRRQSSYAARNEGIRRARGRFLVFTDADCVPESDWLEQGIGRLRSENAGLVAGAVRVLYTGEEPTLAESIDGYLHMNQQEYVEAGWGVTGNLFVRHDCLKEHGAFDETLVSGGDSEFGRRLTNHGVRIVYEDSAVVHHPARRSLGALLRKEWRIGRGIRDLAGSGRLDWTPVTPAEFCPRRSPSELTQVRDGLLWVLKCLVVYNVVRWTNVVSRLQCWNGLGGGADAEQ